MTALVEHRMEGAVLIATLNAPDRRNAISVAMRTELLEILRSGSEDKACRAIILTGAGDHFCSGGDVKDGAGLPPDPERTRRNGAILHDIARLLAGGPKPTIAAVRGSAFGAGFSLAAGCDHIVAGESARFCAAFGKVGLMADTGLMWSLPQRVGLSLARRLLLTARVVGAVEAKAIGLVEDVVPEGDVLVAALEAAEGLTQLAPLSVAAMKAALAQDHASLEMMLAAEAEWQPKLTLSQDYAEGKAAFRERRPPRFQGI